MRKIIALGLAGALTLGIASSALADSKKGWERKHSMEEKFTDWSQQFWANESLARMVTKGVIKGNDDGTIAADRTVTRLEAAIMLVRLLNLEAPEISTGEFKLNASWGEIKVENEDDEFEIELKSQGKEYKLEDSRAIPRWGREAILIALKHGFLVFEGAKLNPMAPLNRLEAAIMLVKAAGLDEEARSAAGAELPFSDAHKIPEKLSGYIALAIEKGFVNGYEDGSFKPQKHVSRAEWAALLDRLDRQGPSVSPDGRQVKGIATAVTVGDHPSITMTTPVFPGGVTYLIDDTALFYKGGKEVTIADIAAGDQLIVNLSPERKILMVTVSNAARQVSGTVSAYTAPTGSTAGSLTLSAGSATTAYAVSPETTVKLGQQAATPADVRVGDKVTLILEGARLTKIMIKVEQVTVQATLSAIAFGEGGALPVLTVTGENNLAATYTMTDAATILDHAGNPLTLADLKAGDLLTLRVERGRVLSIIRKQAASANP